MLDHERVQADEQSAQENAISGGHDAFSAVETPDPAEDMDMATLLEESMSSSEIENGQIITGSVLKVTEDDVVVDIGSKSEGVIPLKEFMDDGKDPNVYVGMDVDVLVVKREGSDGLPVLSRQKAKERKTREMVRDAYKNGDPVKCTIKNILRGGFQVDVDSLRGFIPFSQMGPGARTQEDQKALIGQTIEAKVLEMRRKRDLILSQRQFIEEKREQLKVETMQSLEEGKWIRGIVKNLTDFGAFVDLGGVDGLLHVNDMSWGHVSHPRELVKVGDEIEVMVLHIDGERISLGIKQKTPDPWLTVQEKFPPGSLVGGKVTSMTKYGAFIELEEGVEGLIHISEMDWIKRINHPSEVLSEGEEVRVKILSIDEERKRISLSLKQTTVDPWTLAKNNYPPGTVIEGEITGMTDFGAFVRLPEGVDGMIHVSDLSWGEKVNHPKHVLKKGERIRAKVLEIDPGQQRISLGLKQLEPDPWDAAVKKYPVGSTIEVKVTRLTEFGAFVELEEGIEGLAHSSTLSNEKGKKPEDILNIGDIVVMKVIKFDRPNRKISLSLKDYLKEQEQKEVQKYMAADTGANATLGEMLGEKMQQLMQQKSEVDTQSVEQPPQEENSTETVDLHVEDSPTDEPPVAETHTETPSEEVSDVDSGAAESDLIETASPDVESEPAVVAQPPEEVASEPETPEPVQEEKAEETPADVTKEEQQTAVEESEHTPPTDAVQEETDVAPAETQTPQEEPAAEDEQSPEPQEETVSAEEQPPEQPSEEDEHKQG